MYDLMYDLNILNAILVFFICISVFLIFYLKFQFNSLYKKYLLQKNINENYLYSIKNSNDLKGLYHDFPNHLICIKYLAQNNDIQNLIEYISKIIHM